MPITYSSQKEYLIPEQFPSIVEYQLPVWVTIYNYLIVPNCHSKQPTQGLVLDFSYGRKHNPAVSTILHTLARLPDSTTTILSEVVSLKSQTSDSVVFELPYCENLLEQSEYITAHEQLAKNRHIQSLFLCLIVRFLKTNLVNVNIADLDIDSQLRRDLSDILKS